MRQDRKTVESVERHAGVDVHLDLEECALLMKLATDAEKASYDTATANYFSVCVRIGQRINAALIQSSRR
jgi:hypothetical protein